MADETRTTYTLKTPVKNGTEETITELKFRKPVGKDLRGVLVGQAVDFGAILDIAAKVSGQPPHILDALSAEDTMEVVELVGGFLLRGQPTGPISSP